MERICLDRHGTNVLQCVHQGEESGQRKGALKMKQCEQPSNEGKGGAPQGDVHNELVDIIMSLTESEVKDLISLAASLLT